MRLADLRGRRLVVLGLGEDVAAALDVAVAAGPSEVVVVDAAPDQVRRRLASGHPALAGRVDVLADLAAAPPAEVALRSPGFPLYHPELARRCSAGLTTTTPLDLWVNERGALPAVAVTGTKGKSSTAVLLTGALARLGLPALVLGNIGVPPWARSPRMPEVAVLEISSYQAADLSSTAPVGILTAVGEDHVDWHGSARRYLHDKARAFLAPAAGTTSRWYGYPADLVLPPEFSGAAMSPVPMHSQDIRVRNATLAAAAAIRLAGSDGSTEELARELAADYPNLPGRMATVGWAGGVEFVDDSLASNPLGLAAALRSSTDRPATVIVGGHDRGASADDAAAAMAGRSAPAAVLWLDEGSALAESLRPWCTSVRPAPSLEEAVRAAASLTPAGGVVIFSPGMPTPAAQGNWASRSRRFGAAVAALGSTR